MSDATRLDRREFVKLLGGGIVVFVNLGPKTLFNSRAPTQFQRGYPEDLNAYLRGGRNANAICSPERRFHFILKGLLPKSLRI